ncbi:site-specific DNA-methyltransferase [Aeromicrobium camelliae]|uniref:site-specific DNA-methyltransferase n=1 Tax=Aeromicrobium camelliae TaxID=1538144 RepID=UPI001AA0AD0E|nr:DNA methyltransferase [Aeromicrobium camelliae]
MNDLLRQLRMENPGLADDLQREYDALADRRSFGLNFERHVPEAVELPGRKVRKGDKVRVLPPRGQARKKDNDRLWRVISFSTQDGVRHADLIALDNDGDETSAAVDDLVVVAEFRDPIYPGLVSTGKVERGGDKPFHAVINAENYHALQTLLFTNRGKVDCIYIDPPYNTGAKDWKYNNDYVESDDLYRHSKWLAFMERRLLLAKDLLNPDDSVLIVTIDEKEYLRLGLLLEQIFPDANIQMISDVISPGGASRTSEFTRVNEFVFFVMIGGAVPIKTDNDMLLTDYRPPEKNRSAIWNSLRRRGAGPLRTDSPSKFYPVFVRAADGAVLGAGEPLPLPLDRSEYAAVPQGCIAIWPTMPDGRDGRWELNRASFHERLGQGYVRTSRDAKTNTFIVQYLRNAEMERVASGELVSEGRSEQGWHILSYSDQVARTLYAKTVWNRTSHDAGTHGSRMVKSLLGGRRFPFPKSLYSVEDSLRFFISPKPDALVLDFFAGSGTTAHAVMRLNKQDGGLRRSITVTNNEVANAEQKTLIKQGLRPGDPEWEQWGICDYITKPRIRAAVEGKDPDGKPLKGDYRFTDEFPLAEGFMENVEFFTLTYEAPLRVASNREFEKIAALLWLRAGSRGRRIDDISKGWDVADVYGVISDLDQAEPFLKGIAENDDVAMAFIVTDEDRLFESMVAALPDHVEPVRLYESYLRNFEIEAGRGTR